MTTRSTKPGKSLSVGKLTCQPSSMSQDGLPMWDRLTLDAKLPMVPSPKGAVVLCTTRLCEPIHKQYVQDFDLSDPGALVMSNEYRGLHDQHLESLLCTPQMRNRLYRLGFITADGKVLCTLQEFNKYRQYLRRLELEQLAHERRKEDLQQVHDIIRRRRSGYAGSESIKTREFKAQEVRRRLKEKFELDRIRYKHLMEETEAKRQRIQQEQTERMTQAEKCRHLSRIKHEDIIQRKELDDRRRKLEIYKKWLLEDTRRAKRARQRIRKQRAETESKLKEEWEERKRLQQQRYMEEERRKIEEEKLRLDNIARREEIVNEQRQRQTELFMKIRESIRNEQEEKEKQYREKLKAATVRCQRKARRRQRKHKRKQGQQTSMLKSTWDVTAALMDIVVSADRAGEGDREEIQVDEAVSKPSVTELGLGDFRGAEFDEQEVTVDLFDESDIYDSESSSFISMEDITDSEGEDSDIPPGFKPKPIGFKPRNKLISSLQREIKVHHSSSSINLFATGRTASYISSDDESLSECEEIGDGQTVTFTEMAQKVCDGVVDNVEKASKFLVQWTVTLASKVVAPAIETFSTIYGGRVSPFERPHKPIPPDYLSEEEDLFQTREKGQVRFNMIPNVIEIPASGEQEFYQDIHFDESESEEEIQEGSFNQLKVKDSLTLLGVEETEDDASLCILKKDLTTVLQELMSGSLCGEKVEQLKSVTRDILTSLSEQRKDRDISEFIELSLTEVRSDVENVKSVENVQSEEITDLVKDTLERALCDIKRSKSSVDRVLIERLIDNTLDKVVKDIKKENLSYSSLCNLTAKISKSHENVKRAASTGEITMKKKRSSSTSVRANKFVKAALSKVVTDVKRGKLSNEDLIQMATDLYRQEGGQMRPMDSFTDLTNLNNFIQGTLNTCLSQLSAQMSEQIVADVLSEAIQSPHSSLTDMIEKEDKIPYIMALQSFIDKVLSGAAVDVNKESESSIVITDPVATKDSKSISSEVLDIFLGSIMHEAVNSVENEGTSASIREMMKRSSSASVQNFIEALLSKTKLTIKRSSTMSVDEVAEDVTSAVMATIDESRDSRSVTPRRASDSNLVKSATPPTDATNGAGVTSDAVLKANVELRKSLSTPTTPSAENTDEVENGAMKSLSITNLDEARELKEQELATTTTTNATADSDLSDATDDDVTIAPTLHNKKIDLDKEMFSPALAAISNMRFTDIRRQSNSQSCAKFSFTNLMNPELSRIKGLQTDSEVGLRKQLLKTAMNSPSYHPGPNGPVYLPPDPDSESDEETGFISSDDSEEDENEEVMNIVESVAAMELPDDETNAKPSSDSQTAESTPLAPAQKKSSIGERLSFKSGNSAGSLSTKSKRSTTSQKSSTRKSQSKQSAKSVKDSDEIQKRKSSSGQKQKIVASAASLKHTSPSASTSRKSTSSASSDGVKTKTAKSSSSSGPIKSVDKAAAKSSSTASSKKSIKSSSSKVAEVKGSKTSSKVSPSTTLTEKSVSAKSLSQKSSSRLGSITPTRTSSGPVPARKTPSGDVQRISPAHGAPGDNDEPREVETNFVFDDNDLSSQNSKDSLKDHVSSLKEGDVVEVRSRDGSLSSLVKVRSRDSQNTASQTSIGGRFTSKTSSRISNLLKTSHSDKSH